jgi:hypothetical protein
MTGPVSIDVDTFRAAVSAAVRAPSVYNAQQWRFALRDGAIDVRIDPHRQLPVADPHQWAARIACGAAIANIRLSLAVAGLHAQTMRWPRRDDRLLVATITGNEPRTPSPRQRALHAAITRRHSNRRPFFDAPVPTDARAKMEAAVHGTAAWLSLVSDREPVARIAEIVRAAEVQLHANAAYMAEMNAWIAQVHTDGAGIPLEAAGTAPAGQDLLAMRDFGGRPRAEGRDFEQDPLLAVLGTVGDSSYDDVTAGIALQTVLLTATDARLATSMLSQPIEIPDARDQLRQAIHRHGTPQMIIRVGFGQPVGTSTRRPIDSVIDIPS